MELELQLSNERRALPSVRAMTRAALAELALSTDDAEKLEELTFAAVRRAIEQAYPAGETGAIRLALSEKQGRLEIVVRDFGLPQDIEALESRLHQAEADSPLSETQQVADELHWIGYGREGKAFQILKWLPEAHITAQSDAEELERFEEAVPLAAPQEYIIRRLQPEEAVQVSQLMYRAYGNTYFNEDVYYPQRIAAQNAHNINLSFVAVGAGGVIAGHYALERNQPGPVAEGGQAVVDPAHRGRGLLDRLKAAALQAAEELQLVGWYADAVSVHTLTQQSNAKHGGHLTAVDLGIAPQSECFKNLSEAQTQRVTCLLYFHWLQRPTQRAITVPARHQAMVSKIYRQLGCIVRFVPGVPPQGHGTLAIQADPGGRKAFVRVEMAGADTLQTLRNTKRDLVERAHMEAIYLELSLQDPATAFLAEELEKEGFGFIGIVPHFATTGDLLRMVYLVEPLEREPIKTWDSEVAELVEYVLAEQNRVRQATPVTR